MTDFNTDVMPLKSKFYRLALRLLNDDAEAQDITQETLIRLWTRCATLPSAADAEKLGLTITYNLSRDALTRAGRTHEQLDAIDENMTADSSQSPIDSLAETDRRQFLRSVIERLPFRQQTAVQLRDIEGKPYKEIADIMQNTEEQVKITLFRARQALRNAYKKTDTYEL